MANEWWETVLSEWSESSHADLEGGGRLTAKRFGVQDEEDWDDDLDEEDLDEDLDDWDDDDWDDDDLDEDLDEIDEEPEEEEDEEWG